MKFCERYSPVISIFDENFQVSGYIVTEIWLKEDRIAEILQRLTTVDR